MRANASVDPATFFGVAGFAVDDPPLAKQAAPAGSTTPGAPNDPLFEQQWHLWDTAVGLNVLGAWADYTGAGVRVGIYDSGVDFSHPDLAANYNPFFRVRVDGQLNTGRPDARDTTGQSNHGSAVAGLIGAARDGVGVVGAAYDASLTAVEIFSARWAPQLPELLAAMKTFDVVNHSWTFSNPIDDNRTTNTPDSFYGRLFAAIEDAAADGRDGLGTIMVQASGNFTMRSPNDDHQVTKHDLDTNLHGMQNARQTIAVGATTEQGTVTFWSVAGTSLLVVAPDGGFNPLVEGYEGVLTTDRPGEAGYTDGDYTSFNGTSAAAPLVTGVVALMLEANPELGWRDVQNILAASARHSGAEIGEPGVTGVVGDNVVWTIYDIYPWMVNSAQTWNGGGHHYSGDYGFGLVDALAAVRLAESWGVRQTSANEATATATAAGPWAIDDLSTHTMTFQITQDITVESVEIFLDFTVNHGSMMDLDITLTSPNGTTYSVMHDAGTAWELWDWKLLSRAYLGKSALGQWTLSIHDDQAEHTGTLGSVGFSVYGAEATVDDVYIFTDEFAEMLALNARRGVLRDADGGVDTLNFAAVSSDLQINLRSGGACAADGVVAKISHAVFENVYCGDGADQVIGNAVANSLWGARNDDRLQGRDGDDLLNGGDGNDTLDGGKGKDRLDGGLGSDKLTGGAGADRFLLSSADANPDVINDLTANDKLDLRAVDADSTKAGNQAFTRVETLDGHAGQIALTYDAVENQTLLQGDIDGDGVADFTVALAHGDFTDFTNFVL